MQKPNLKIRISLSMFVLLVSAFLLSKKYSEAADAIDKYISMPTRRLLCLFTSGNKGSAFEGMIIVFPTLLFLIIFFTLRGNVTRGVLKRRFLNFLSLFLAVASLWLLTVGVAYNKTPIYRTLENTTVNEIRDTAEKLSSEVISLSMSTERSIDIESEIQNAYRKFGYGKARFPSVKTMNLSELAEYLGITALYSFFSSEVLINDAVPDYAIPFTAAHEYAHYLGILSEGEANFTSFIVLYTSDSPTLRYSAIVSALEYLLGDLRRADVNLYNSVYSELPEYVISDISLWQSFDKKSNSKAGEISDKINSHHLNTFDRLGEGSYSSLTGFIVSYFDSLAYN